MSRENIQFYPAGHYWTIRRSILTVSAYGLVADRLETDEEYEKRKCKCIMCVPEVKKDEHQTTT